MYSCHLLDAGYIPPEEFSGSSTLYIVQRSADHWCVVHLFLRLASPLKKTKQYIMCEFNRHLSTTSNRKICLNHLPPHNRGPSPQRHCGCLRDLQGLDSRWTPLVFKAQCEKMKNDSKWRRWYDGVLDTDGQHNTLASKWINQIAFINCLSFLLTYLSVKVHSQQSVTYCIPCNITMLLQIRLLQNLRFNLAG